jgi:uncharacterized YigZ family protein
MAVYTLAQAVHADIDIRKSRFIAIAMPVEGRDAAQLEISRLRAGHPAATHVCWALLAGGQSGMSDDGEPSGTAGRPIMEVLRHHELDNVLGAVVRYFGGIKLGAGGLVRAYGGTAAECLRRAERVPIVAMARLGLRCDFAELALLKARLKDLQAEVEHETFGADGVELQLRLPDGRVAEACLRIGDISRGRSEARRLD